MPEPTLEEKKVDGGSDISKFEDVSNPGIAELDMTDSQIADKRASEKVIKDTEKVVDDPPDKKVDAEDDFLIPSNEDDPFAGIDAPLDTEDKIVEPDPKKKDKGADSKEDKANIRAGIEEANRRAKAADDRAQLAESENEGLRGRITDMEAGLTEAQEKLSYKDPSQHPDIVALIEPYDRELDDLSRAISLNGGNGSKLKTDARALIQEFNSLGDPGSEGYAERRDNLIGKIDEDYPEDRKEIIGMLQKGASTFSQVQAKIAEIQKNGSEKSHSDARAFYDEHIKDYTDAEEQFFNPSQELRESDPANARVLLSDLNAGSEAGQKRSDDIKKMARFGLNPLAPVSPKEISGMGNEEVATYLEKRRVQHAVAQKHIRETYVEGAMAKVYLPVLVERLAKAEGQLQDLRRADPKLSGEDDDERVIREKREKKDGETDKIENFDPGQSNLDLSRD